MRSYSAGLTIPADSPVDLQTHTHLSDGRWSPEALIDHFVSEGFAAAAITDHDRVDTMAQIQRIARERGFPLLMAAEMTTRWRDSLVDILCFGFEADPAPLQNLCEALRQEQIDSSREVYENLVSSGHLPTYDQATVDAIVEAKPSQQTDMLVDLFVRHNSAEDLTPIREAGYKLCTSPVAAVVEAVHQGGGVALIAHPGRADGFVRFDADLLDQLRAEIPIDGIEVYYPRHTAEQTALYEAYATEHDWLISAGSDSHSPEQPPIPYRAEQCAALLARLDITVTP